MGLSSDSAYLNRLYRFFWTTDANLFIDIHDQWRHSEILHHCLTHFHIILPWWVWLAQRQANPSPCRHAGEYWSYLPVQTDWKGHEFLGDLSRCPCPRLRWLSVVTSYCRFCWNSDGAIFMNLPAVPIILSRSVQTVMIRMKFNFPSWSSMINSFLFGAISWLSRACSLLLAAAEN